MVDTRAARVLAEDRRAMLDPQEAAWVRSAVLDDPSSYDHLLIGSSLPWLLPPLIHDVERWNAALCAGVRGSRWARFGEKLRRAADLEHWAAFPDSFDRFTELLREAGSGPDAPATVCVLSGDVHHAYITEPHWPKGRRTPGADSTPGPRRTPPPVPVPRPAKRDGPHPPADLLPVHNSVPRSIRAGFRFGWSRTGRRIGRALARHGRTGRSPVEWGREGGPWFGNQLMTLTLRGRNAALTLVQATAGAQGPSSKQFLSGHSPLRMRRFSDTRQNVEVASTAEVCLTSGAQSVHVPTTTEGAPPCRPLEPRPALRPQPLPLRHRPIVRHPRSRLALRDVRRQPGGGRRLAGWYAALIQLVCGSLVALGLGTRAAAFLASGSMAYAYFKVHQPESLLPIENGGEPSALFCWAFLLLVFTGPGAVALDRLFGARNTAAASEDTPRHDRTPAVSI